jgi:hypothetical protein
MCSCCVNSAIVNSSPAPPHTHTVRCTVTRVLDKSPCAHAHSSKGSASEATKAPWCRQATIDKLRTRRNKQQATSGKRATPAAHLAGPSLALCRRPSKPNATRDTLNANAKPPTGEALHTPRMSQASYIGIHATHATACAQHSSRACDMLL